MNGKRYELLPLCTLKAWRDLPTREIFRFTTHKFQRSLLSFDNSSTLIFHPSSPGFSSAVT
jgi:hypothetical protein